MLSGITASSSTAPSARLVSEMPAVFGEHFPQSAWGDWLLTQVGTAVDEGVLALVRYAIEMALLPEPDEMPALRQIAAPFLADRLQDDPASFFADLPPLPQRPRIISRHRRELRHGVAVSRRIENEYAPRIRRVGTEGALDCVIPVEHWTHDHPRGRGTVICLHGFTMGWPSIDAMVLQADTFYRMGLDVALLTLPSHGQRASRDARFSGQAFASADLGTLSEAVRQSVHEVRLVARWLRDTTARPVGLLGFSLGGYISALTAAFDPDLDFVVSMVPPACFGDLAWRFFSETRAFRNGAEPFLTQQELRRAFRVHSPLAHAPVVPKEKLLIVAGRGDRIVPPEHPNALWLHWGQPSIHWFHGSHLAPFGRASCARAVRDHLSGLGIIQG